MTPEFEVYPASSAADMNAVRGLFTAYQDWLGGDLCFRNFERELADLPGVYAAPAGCLLLARNTGTGQIAGVVGIQPDTRPGSDDRRACEMKRLYVVPEAQGHGLGRRISEAGMSFARQAGYARMCLRTLPHLTTAIRLYQAMGFVGDSDGAVICMSMDL